MYILNERSSNLKVNLNYVHNMPISKRNKLGLDNKNLIVKNNKLYEDTSEYGEFVSSFDSWLTLEEQKRNADYLANIEENNKKEMEDERFKN